MTTALPSSRLSVHRLRADLASVLGRVRDDGTYVVVTRRGAPVAAVVPVEVLDLIRAVADPLALRGKAAAADVHDLATAAPAVAPGPGSATGSPAPCGRPDVPGHG
ncbi:MAG: type II toxin-antitoxin system prevent-host-death family antitoxin [Planctomycetia bacterium]